MDIRFLTGVPLETIAAAFNFAFSDYLVKVQVTPESLAVKFRQESIDPGWSVGAFEGENLVGFILNGFRPAAGGTVLYNGGTGVVPSARGRGLTKRLYDFLLPKAERAGVALLQLEVIRENEKALHVYESCGFSVVRPLLCLSGKSPAAALPQQFAVRRLKGLPDPFVQEWWTSAPSFPAATGSLENIADRLLVMGACSGGEPAGYAVMLPSNGRIFQLAVAPRFRRQGLGRALVSALFGEVPHETAMALNVDGNDRELLLFFESMGWSTAVYQLEMKRSL